MIDLGWTLHHLKAWPEALEAWGALSRSYPTEWLGILGGAATLRQLKRFDEAEALLLEGREQLGEHPACEVDLAWVATERKDWAVAIERWEGVRENRPDQVVGYLGGALALRESKRFDEAEGLLRNARERFPDNRQVLVDLGHVKVRRRDFAGAAEIWEEVRAQFPKDVESYIWGSFALRELRQLQAAEELLRAGLELHPTHQHLLADLARLAQLQGDWGETLRRWEAAGRVMPGAIEPQIGRAAALRGLRRFDEALSSLRELMEHFPERPEPMAELGHLAAQRGQWTEAAEAWERLRQKFPDREDGYLHGGAALRVTRRHADARAVMEQGRRVFPNAPGIVAELGRLALDCSDFERAEQLFAELRHRFPERAEGYVGGARVRMAAHDVSGADELYGQAAQAVLHEPHVLLEYARVRLHKTVLTAEDWEAVSSRFSDLHVRFPTFDVGFVECVRAFRRFGKLDQAENYAHGALERLPQSPLIAVEYAYVARDRQDWPEAERRFTAVIDRFPEVVAGVTGLADVLVRTGRSDEAEALVSGALARLPDDRDLLMRYAAIATRNGNWTEALTRWEYAAGRHPYDDEIRQNLFGAQQVAAPVASGGSHDMAGERAAGADRARIRELLMCFESLAGNDMGCEFGLFQREFGAEPLGLLRWSNIAPDDLALALETEVEGVGLAENTGLVVTPEPHREYMLRDRRFGLAMHTFTSAEQVEFGRMFQQSFSRLQYLRRKLIDDLRLGEKIFVYRTPDRVLTSRELKRIRDGMRAYGENTLLYVRLADAAHKPGTVVRADEQGLLIGYIDRFRVTPDGVRVAPNPAGWLAVCERAYELWSTGFVELAS